ncbi:hypothetical protein AU468_02245 [Alkalispirochaeta sphaeroplastigenens]|uniref:Glycogen synthase n=1 Tax=Alkalispirochaeta sphaeroplastigenens TaxID=1187066 RepID=A0A2S4K098_9SPIO|nr:glycogen/starch synthase [Alkalispirochaeta sphaeroplastigenens]POR05187.1 hypothetical protein AU468_02245 [Alkalispirochaeta sphaeroplastigenens]
MHILFVTSEVHPLAKSGGLADAVASLAKTLASRGNRVSLVLPRYGSIDSKTWEKREISLKVPLGDQEILTGWFYRRQEGLDLYALDHRDLLGRSGIYGPSPAEAYEDNLLRFALLSRGALELALALDLEPAVIHTHDWPTALVPIFHRLFYQNTPLGRARTVFSIHNFGYQGWAPLERAHETGLSREELDRAGLCHNGEINLVRGALIAADTLVAVSPRYAREIQTPPFGFGLHQEAARQGDKLTGILNGIDQDEWNPETDTALPARYSRKDRRGKALCKEALQIEFGLPPEPGVPLVGMVTRLTEQKGIGALFGSGGGEEPSLRRICRELPLQVILIGTGEVWCQEEILRMTGELPNFSALVGYSEALAHRITAGSDFFLMPSTYEPCGLNQLYALRYGTIPVVTSTGGLADTVDRHTGLLIRHYSPGGIVSALQEACRLYREAPLRLEEMRDTAMARDFGWSRSARDYQSLYGAITGETGSASSPGTSRE